jgi:hypothetical protein
VLIRGLPFQLQIGFHDRHARHNRRRQRDEEKNPLTSTSCCEPNQWLPGTSQPISVHNSFLASQYFEILENLPGLAGFDRAWSFVICGDLLIVLKYQKAAGF